MYAIGDQLEEILQRQYSRWKNADLPIYLSKELNELKSAEIIDRFYQDLQLADTGIYGIIGVGTNRINIYTIRRVCQGVAEEVKSRGFAAQQRGIVIGYDARSISKGLAEQAALVLANNDVKCYLFQQTSPVGELAFAVRYMHASGGLMMSGGSSTADCGGCTIYNEYGLPIDAESSRRLSRFMEPWGDGLHIKTMYMDEAVRTGRLVFVGSEISRAYLKDTDRIPVSQETNQIVGASVRMMYVLPDQAEADLLLGTLSRAGFTSIYPVEDELTKEAAATCPLEQVDWGAAYEAAAEYDADLVLAFNPEASELALSVKRGRSQYTRLSHDDTAALLLHYLLEQRSSKGQPVSGGMVLKSVFTGDLVQHIARKHGLRTIAMASGSGGGYFLPELYRAGTLPFLFGHDEDGGYTIGGIICDRDAIAYALLIAEMSAYYKSKGKTIYKELMDLYEEHGWFADERLAFSFQGLEGRQRVSFIMGRLGKDALRVIGGLRVERLYDCRSREQIHLAKGKHYALEMPRSDALKFVLEDGSWYGLQAVSAQPGIRLFLGAQAGDHQSSRRKLAAIRSDVLYMLEGML